MTHNAPHDGKRVAARPPELMNLKAIRTCLLRARVFIDEHGNATAPSLRQLRSYANSDIMPGRKIGRDWYVPKQAFLQFLQTLMPAE